MSIDLSQVVRRFEPVLRRGPSQDQARRRRRRRRRLALEALEERVVLSSSIPISATDWTPVGPAPIAQTIVPGTEASTPLSGRTVGVVSDPGDSNTILIATAGGGVWRTTDGGQNWLPKTDDQAIGFMGSIAMSPSDSNVLYAGTGEADGSPDSGYGRGILVSRDGGETWSLTGQSVFDRRAVGEIAVDPDNPDVAYAAVGGSTVNGVLGGTGIFKTSDGGETWRNTTVTIGNDQPFSSVVLNSQDPKIVYAAVGTPTGSAENGVYRSTDGGDTWEPAGNFAMGGENGRIQLAISPSNPFVLYAAVPSPSSGNLLDIFKTSDGGETWSPTASPPEYFGGQGGSHNFIVVDPTNPDIVYAGGSNNLGAAGIVQSLDGGATWTAIEEGTNGVSPQTGYHQGSFDAMGRLLVVSDGGIWRLNDPSPASIQWSNLNGNLQITQFSSIALHPTDSNIAYGGSRENGTSKFNDSLGWTLIQSGDGGGLVRIDPTSPNTVYRSGAGNSLERSDDGGQTWVDISEGIQGGSSSSHAFLQVDSAGRVLFGTDRINVSNDKGQTWIQISTPGLDGWPAPGAVNAIGVAPNNTNMIYAAMDGVLYVTNDNGANWSRSIVPGNNVAEIQVDPLNGSTAYVVRDVFGGGRVFRTNDGGRTWSNLSGDLPDIPTNTIALAQQADGSEVLLVGNDVGVFASTNGGRNWNRFKEGLPTVQVLDLHWNPATQILAAGTYGRGMFQTLGASSLDIETLELHVTENDFFSEVLATFQPQFPGQDLSDFSVMIDWGDGSPESPGTLSETGDGRFQVTGEHTYEEGGLYNYRLLFTIVGVGHGQANGLAVVANLPIEAEGVVIEGLKEGDTFDGIVATFHDTDPDPMTPGDYSVLITWGDDGTETPGIVEVDPSGGFNHFVVKGTHLFGGGNSEILVEIVGPGENRVTVTSLAIVEDSPLFSEGFDVEPLEGVPFTLPVARFEDTDPREPPASNYFATIDWGDGSEPTAGIITEDFAQDGFFVSGDHVYDPGTYEIIVTIGNYSGDSTTVARGIATVLDSPITASGFDFSAVEGQTFNKFLASFFDDDPRIQPPSRYKTTIDWGDGSPVEPGTVQVNIDGGYLLRGPHAYRLPGLYTYEVTIQDALGSSTATASGTINVLAAPISVQIQTQASPQEGQAFQDTIASFVSQNPQAQITDFQATIDWGDGSITPSASIRLNPLTGQFEVSGSQVYEDAGTYTISVSVRGLGGQRASASGQIVVHDAPLTAEGRPVSLQSKTEASPVVVASFLDANPKPKIEQFSATINWGDGTQTDGLIVPNDQGGFDVVGSHEYGQSGNFPIHVAIFSSAGSTASAETIAVVTPRLFPISGHVVGGSPSGLAPHVVNSHTPTLAGQAEPNAQVTLFGSPSGTEALGPLATATADANGHWQVTIPSLPDGSFTIVASAIDAQGDPSSAPTPILSAAMGNPLIIDTQGPTVQNVLINPRTGQVQVTLVDSGSGLSPETLSAPGNFTLSVVGPGLRRTALPLSGLDFSPDEVGQRQTAILTFSGLRRLQRGTYVLQISAAGVTDLAGNPLDERYFLPFPALYSRPGQNFEAQFTIDGSQVSPISQFIPPAQRRGARLFELFLQRHRARLRG